jgi:hypothetical protein
LSLCGFVVMFFPPFFVDFFNAALTSSPSFFSFFSQLSRPLLREQDYWQVKKKRMKKKISKEQAHQE